MPRSISLLIDYLMRILTLIVTYQCLFALFRPQSHAMNYSDQTETESSCSNRLAQCSLFFLFYAFVFFSGAVVERTYSSVASDLY